MTIEHAVAKKTEHQPTTAETVKDLHKDATRYIDSLSPLQLLQEYKQLVQGAKPDMQKDAKACTDAFAGDQSGRADLKALLKGKPGAAGKVTYDITDPDNGDLPGDVAAAKKGQTPVIDPKNPNKKSPGDGADQDNAKHDALIRAAEQRILMEGLNGHGLSHEQVLALKADIKAKEGDLINSVKDIPLEMRYQADDERLLAAMKNPGNKTELDAAIQAVMADRRLDMLNELGAKRDHHKGGYFGQDKRSITATERILRDFRITFAKPKES